MKDQTIKPLSGKGECKEYRRHNYLVVRIGNEEYGDKKVGNEVYSDFVQAITKDKGYDQVTAGFIKLKRQPLLRQIYEFRDYQEKAKEGEAEAGKAKKCEDKKVATINLFESYWEMYISPSFTRYLNNETTDIDLSAPQLREIFTELSNAINAVMPHTAAAAKNFILPNQVTPDSQKTAETEAGVIKKGIKDLIEKFNCS